MVGVLEQLEPYPPFISLTDKMGGGPKVPYPKHVWSPAGGWYTQPANWKLNTVIFSGVVFGIAALAFNLSAEREFRHQMPEPHRFFPSRYWSKQVKEYEAAQKANKNDS
ncbi:hypothetical protein F5X99DRAFT_406579 [Biscogniauxia marginata]|nr:hypothetical protein F5X99DRAFT_406579 [Biscogniauxia marginata]